MLVISRAAFDSIERSFPIASRTVLDNLRRKAEQVRAAVVLNTQLLMEWCWCVTVSEGQPTTIQTIAVVICILYLQSTTAIFTCISTAVPTCISTAVSTTTPRRWVLSWGTFQNLCTCSCWLRFQLHCTRQPLRQQRSSWTAPRGARGPLRYLLGRRALCRRRHCKALCRVGMHGHEAVWWGALNACVC